MNCPKCGANLMPGARFCGACGFTVGQTSAPSPTAGGSFNFDSDGRGEGRGYRWRIEHQGAFALAVIELGAEQSISAEAGAMVSMSANVDLNAEMKGGLFGALKRAVGGESAFVSTFTAKGGPGEVTLAPGAPGDISGIEMSSQTFMVQSSSYLAGDTSLAVETKFGGAKAWLGGEGLFVLQVSGAGLLLVSSFGAIHRRMLRPGERYVVDTGHLVAWEGHMQYTLRKAAASGFFRSMMSGEGLVAEFSGPGELLIQTRNLEAFALTVATAHRNPVELEISQEFYMPRPAMTPKTDPKTSDRLEVRLKARAVARGIAIGRVVCLYGRKRQFYRVAIQENGVAREIKRLQSAIRLAQKQLRRVTTGRGASENLTNVFEAQLAMLDDQGLRQKLESYIAEEHVNAEWAVKVVTDGYVTIYKSIPDEHLREKYLDLEDVADRILTALGGAAGRAPLKLARNSIIVASEVRPSTLLELAANEPLAIITEHGGWTSHTFILAREMNLPAVTGVKGILRRVETGTEVIVDGFNGQAIINPTAQTIADFAVAAADFRAVREQENDFGREPVRTLDGVEVTLRANFDLPQGFVKARKYGVKGIGLYRSEFLFNQFKGFPSEQQQVRAYRQIAKLAGEDGVRIRTFDLAAEQVTGADDEKEANPALGLRALRLMNRHKTQFRTQIRAILQAARGNKIDILLPMVTDVSEITDARRIIERERNYLQKRGVEIGETRLGSMIEVPAAVMIADEIAAAVDFICLGTNDLVQYLLAVDRDNEAVADWFRTLHPAVLRSIARVVECAAARNVPVTVCGEMAGSPFYAAILIGLGVTELSMNVNSVGRVRRIIANIAFEEAREIVRQVDKLRTADDVEEFVGTSFRQKWAHLFSTEILPSRVRSGRRRNSPTKKS